MIQLFYYIYYGSAVIYIAFILFCWVGWRRIPIQANRPYNPSTSVTVIVPARNEEVNILNCMEDLAEQDYPAAMYEVILVDDHSTDATAELVKEFADVNNEKRFIL